MMSTSMQQDPQFSVESQSVPIAYLPILFEGTREYPRDPRSALRAPDRGVSSL